MERSSTWELLPVIILQTKEKIANNVYTVRFEGGPDQPPTGSIPRFNDLCETAKTLPVTALSAKCPHR